MSRELSSERFESLERVTEKGLQKQAEKDVKSVIQMSNILKLWKESGLSFQYISVLMKAVASWNIQDQAKFYRCLDAFGKLAVKLDYAHKVLDENPSLGVVAIFLHTIEEGNRSYEFVARRLTAGLSAQERQEVWRLYCARELPEHMQYLPTIHFRLHLLLPKKLRRSCKSNSSLYTVWISLPQFDWNRKLYLCSSWYMEQVLALRQGDKIWQKVVKKYDNLGLLLQKDPSFETLRAQLTE